MQPKSDKNKKEGLIRKFTLQKELHKPIIEGNKRAIVFFNGKYRTLEEWLDYQKSNR